MFLPFTDGCKFFRFFGDVVGAQADAAQQCQHPRHGTGHTDQEKASKSIKSTAATISSSIKTISQEIFSKKTETAIINEGYAQFITRYESDMKQLEAVTKSLEESHQHTLNAWV